LQLTVEKGLRRRWKSRITAEKLLLHRQRDSVQPLLGSVCPFLMMLDFGFPLPNPVFSGPQFSRHKLTPAENLLVLCLGVTGCAVNQPQDGLGCPVDWIASLRLGIQFGC
jgi:hypothetical protein